MHYTKVRHDYKFPTEIQTTIVEFLGKTYVDINKGKILTPKEYVSYYTAIYNYCISTSSNGQDSIRINIKGTRALQPSNHTDTNDTTLPNSSSDVVGEEIYYFLKDWIADYSNQLTAKFNGLYGDDLLREYNQIWINFLLSSSVTNGIFRYLNRHWITRKLEEGSDNVRFIINMLVTEFKNQLFDKFSPSLVTAVLQLIEKERNNQSINSGLISETLQSYVYMGITLYTGVIPTSMPTKDNTAPTFKKKDDSEKVVIRSVKNTAIYKQEFEIEFLGQTKAWYERHSAQLLEIADVPEYLMKAEDWMTAEIDRCDRLMDKSTLDPLQLCLNQSLITDHLDIFRAQFEGLLANDKQDDLRRLYTLSFGTPDAELHFTTILKKYISTYGVEKINGIADDAKDDPKMYLTSIIEIYNQFTSVVKTSFKNDKAYVEALDKAFQEIINANRVVANDRRGKKTHELVAKYADTILKKTNRIGDSCELDEKLKDIVTVFRYIEDKDSFLQFYSRFYARRLINDLSVGDDSEMSLINSMKAICGFDYTTKLMKMNKDMALSKSVSDEFKQSRLQQSAQPKKVDFSIHILTNGSWPYKQVYTLQVPKCMKSTMEDFSSFYIQKHSGRKLTFLFDQSKGEIQCNVFAKKHIFVCLTNQMAVIMQFNDKDSCTYGELKRALQSGDTELKAALLGFAKSDILLVDGATFKVNEGKEVTEETVYLLNTNFTNKKVKIDLTKGTAKVETNKGLQTMNASIESDRKLHLEAIIVRIMKARKEMRHQQLVSDVVGFVKKRFRPEIPHIKRSIDVLIEKGYIKRDANERDLYQYLA